MQLWNDYEGKTIVGKYLLGPLVGPEGRSALFTTEDAGAPAVIAVTESLNDEEQMLECWAKIAVVKQENLVALREFGRTELEGAPLTYVVMEPGDGTLADLLKERAVTQEEAVQIAVSLAGALEALHRDGIAHGHVRAENVIAVGETVKLRTDCIRACGPEGEWAAKDVQDLALLLLRGLTLERKLTPETKLPGPFDRIVEKGMNGSWGLQEILAAVAPPAVASPMVKPVAVVADLVAHPAAPVQYTLPVMRDEVVEEVALPVRRVKVPLVSVGSPTYFGFDWKVLAGGAAGLVVLILLGLHFFRGKPDTAAAVTAPAVVSAPTHVAAPAPVTAPVVAGAHTPAGRMQAGWYVIAYTYNRESEAWKKVASITKRHPGLQPEVVAPGGHGPFLVAIGGPMTRDGATSARSKAMREGMPRDTFVRNYAGG